MDPIHRRIDWIDATVLVSRSSFFCVRRMRSIVERAGVASRRPLRLRTHA